MSGLTLVFGLFFYVSLAIFLGGFLGKIWQYASTPAPLKIPQTPAPVTAGGVGIRYLQEVFVFKSLFKGNKLLWVGGYLFHLGLLFVLVEHLRFIIVPTSSILNFLVAFDLYSGFVLLAALVFLFILRVAVDRHAYISLVNDYLLLLLLMGIAGTGLLSRFWSGGHIRAHIPAIKAFVGGLVTFHNIGAVPTNKLFLIHFSLVMLLLIYFPFSKLMHAGGIFFSPSRNQVDNPRERRWTTPWVKVRPTATLPRLEREAAAAPVQVAQAAPESTAEA